MAEFESKKSWLMSLEKRLPWGVLGALATVILGAPALYLTLRETTPKATIEILSVANVFDVYRSLPELTVIFKGKNIQESGKNIRVVTLALTNAGDKNIVQGDYDQDLPFGFSLPKAEIVGSPRIIRADTDYLEKFLRPRTANENTVEFTKIILEKGQTVVFELVVLQDKDAPLLIKPIGKISGQKEIPVRDRNEENKPGFWRSLVQGSLTTNLFRFIAASILFILLLALAISSAIWLESKSSGRKRKRALRYLKPLVADLDSETQNTVLALFSTASGTPDGLRKIVRQLRTVDGLKLIKEEADRIAEEKKAFEKMRERHRVPASAAEQLKMKEAMRLRQLARHYARLVEDRDGALRANEKLLVTLENLCDYSKQTPPPKKIEWDTLNPSLESTDVIGGQPVFYGEPLNPEK